MAGKMSSLSLSSRSLKHKLIIAFQLMSILPLLVSIYLVSNYILPKFGFKVDVLVTVGTSIFVALVGLLVIKEVFDRVAAMTSEAKMIVAGDISHKLLVEHNDEVGDLGNVLNQLTDHMRDNMEELKSYSEKTIVINLEIQKRVIMLSNLMQISSLISAGAKLNETLKISIEKSRFLADSDMAFLLFREEPQDVFSVKIAEGTGSEYLYSASVNPEEDIYKKGFNLNKPFVLDKQTLLGGNLAVSFYEKFHLKNILTMPIFIKNRVKAVLVIGNNREAFIYSKDDVELLDIFSKQIAIAIENDFLSSRITKLEIKDALTGLYNESFIRGRLKEEIKRAIVYQRPCSFVVFGIDNFEKYQQNSGLINAEGAVKKVATLIKGAVTEVDRAGRIGDDEFAVILPERNKRQAKEMAEEILKVIEFSYSEEADSNKKITVSAGVSENPLDGVEAQQLILKARELLMSAKSSGSNRVVAF